MISSQLLDYWPSSPSVHKDQLSGHMVHHLTPPGHILVLTLIAQLQLTLQSPNTQATQPMDGPMLHQSHTLLMFQPHKFMPLHLPITHQLPIQLLTFMLPLTLMPTMLPQSSRSLPLTPQLTVDQSIPLHWRDMPSHKLAWT